MEVIYIMGEDIKTNHENKGSVTFANEVVATIAALATCDIPGVAGMCGGFVGGIAEMLGKKNLTKGVKVTVKENSVFVELEIIVDYGVKVPDVCAAIQESVAKGIETMTGLEVAEINIAVQGVKFPEPAVPAPAEEK